MAVGFAVPDGVAGDIDALATSVLAKTGITATDAFPLGVGDFKVACIRVTGDTVAEIRAAVQKNAFALDLGGATGGSCTIDIDGVTSGAIAFDDNAAAVEATIEAMSSVLAATVTGAGTSADPFGIVVDRAAATPDVAGVEDQPKIWPTITVDSLVDSTTGGSGVVLMTPVANLDIFRGSVPA